eukprot:24497-Chlamydomonas_euryale.AAC.1
MGVGGDDSWSPSVHAQYLVPPAAYGFSLALIPVHGGIVAPDNGEQVGVPLPLGAPGGLTTAGSSASDDMVTL